MDGIGGFSKVSPFASCELHGVDDKYLCSSPTCQLTYGLVDDILATLYWTIQGKGRFDWGTGGGDMSCTVLSLWVKGDVEISQCLFKQF